MNVQFLNDTLDGLKQPQKRLSSKYFYDEIGDKLFQEIMKLEEYYLPACELEILSTQTEQIASAFGFDTVDIVELGSGDGSKTVHFLKKLVDLGKKVVYYPLDISADVLKTNQQNIQNAIPDLEMYPLAGDYFDTLSYLRHDNPKILLFMGSNIGNYQNDKAMDFVRHLSDHMNPGDWLMLGVDLKKNPQTILNAYNDRKGVTKQFNLNLLHRINRELGGNFNVDLFDHYPLYEPVSGIAYSYLVSLAKQIVTINGVAISFEKNELIHTEVSQKYSLQQLENIRAALNLHSVQHFLDTKEYYTVSLYKK